MANSLHTLIKALATANDERELRLRFMDRVGEYFNVQRWGIHLLDAQSCLAEFEIQGLADVFVEDHEHIMTGPIVGSGCLIGTVHFARVSNT